MVGAVVPPPVGGGAVLAGDVVWAAVPGVKAMVVTGAPPLAVTVSFPVNGFTAHQISPSATAERGDAEVDRPGP